MTLEYCAYDQHKTKCLCRMNIDYLSANVLANYLTSKVLASPFGSKCWPLPLKENTTD